MVAAFQSVPSWAFLLLLCCGTIVAIRAISMVFRSRIARMCLMFCLTLVCLGGVFVLFAPMGPPARWTNSTRLVPPMPPIPHIGVPVAAPGVEEVSIQGYLEAAKSHGERAASAARVKIQEGGEALAEFGDRVSVETHRFAVEHHLSNIPHRTVAGLRQMRSKGIVAWGLTAFAIGALLYLGYLLLDASTRGQFTWSLRLASLLTFAALCAAMSVLRHGL